MLDPRSPFLMPSESPQLTPSGELSTRGAASLHVLEFSCVLLIPWILDLLGSRAVFASIFGASAWGLAVALSGARLRSKDPHFRKSLGIALLGVTVVWLLFWGLSFFEHSRPLSDLKGLPRWLMLTHAGLLAAGVGMVLLNLVASVTWLVQNDLLKKSSWERRSQKWTLPSLEALGKLSHGSVDLAFASWGMGFFLAILNGILSWSHSQALGWLKDPKVVFTALLWLLLAASFQLSHIVSKSSRRIYFGYIILSILFIGLFWGFLGMGKYSNFHEPIKWF